MGKFSKILTVRIAALTAMTVGLSGCVYDLGLGYGSNGYADGGYYDCDPYSPYDRYYDCDSGYGFSNIGFGGGWYDSYWYPGYGYHVFDNGGRQYNMSDRYRNYWGQRRYEWYRGNHGRRGDNFGRGRDGRDHDNYGRGRDRYDRDRRDGRDGRNGADGRDGRDGGGQSPGYGAGYQPRSAPQDNGGRGGPNRGYWNNGSQLPPQGSNAVPPPQPAVPQAQPQPAGRGDGRGSRGFWPPRNQPDNAAPVQQPAARTEPDGRGEWGRRGEGRSARDGGDNRSSGWPQPAQATPQMDAPAPPRADPPQPRAPRIMRPDFPRARVANPDEPQPDAE